MRHPHRRARRLILAGLLLLVGNAQAELYKCRDPHGRTTYQQTACDPISQSSNLEIESQTPADAGPGQDYSIEKQLETMRGERSLRAKAREREASKRAATENTDRSRDTRYDAAKCARHRSEVAKWRQKVRDSYRTRSEKEYKDERLAYHQTLVDRYCEE